MTPVEAIAITAAGTAAGAVNTVIGSGSLITFPTLLAFGFSPVTANVSNNIGLVPGSVSGAVGYRRELRGQAARARSLVPCSVTGSLLGATLLLRLPSDVFDAVVPVLILLACGLMLAQPRLGAWIADRRREGRPDVGAVPIVLAFASGIYGGYFGAAQGVILLAVLAVFVPDQLHRSNALKNVLAATVNGSAAVLFIVFADVSWTVVALIALGATLGGVLGSRFGRLIPTRALRYLVVVLGLGVTFKLILG